MPRRWAFRLALAATLSLAGTADVRGQPPEPATGAAVYVVPSGNVSVDAIAQQIRTAREDGSGDAPLPGRPVRDASPVMRLLYFIILAIVLIVSVYTVRHYAFTLNRLFGRQRHPYTDILTATWPTVTVLIPSHNEEAVIANILDALLAVDYPRERIRIIPINDRSTDATKSIIDGYAAQYPELIVPFHRFDGKPGKAAALKDASSLVTSDIQLVFDADYIPGRRLIKQLVAPFFDPEVGAVMGRVVPLNSRTNLLTRLLDLERTGGYQVDQQARMNLGLVPQYGGTVGGVRQRALEEAGGWRDDTLAEDTDLTYRLLLNGWLTVYQNRSECYEEVPEAWPVRIRQISRWARGHNQSLARYLLPLMRGTPRGGLLQLLDGILLLGIYVTGPLIGVAWIIALVMFYAGESLGDGMIAALAVSSYSTLGNFAPFFEVAAGARLDGSHARCRLLPLLLGGFLISLVSITNTFLPRDFLRPKRGLVWDKTTRYRRPQ